jgi:hypothetical protein
VAETRDEVVVLLSHELVKATQCGRRNRDRPMINAAIVFARETRWLANMRRVRQEDIKAKKRGVVTVGQRFIVVVCVPEMSSTMGVFYPSLDKIIRKLSILVL